MQVDNFAEVFYTHGYSSHYIYPMNVTRFIVTCRLFLFAHTSHMCINIPFYQIYLFISTLELSNIYKSDIK